MSSSQVRKQSSVSRKINRGASKPVDLSEPVDLHGRRNGTCRYGEPLLRPFQRRGYLCAPVYNSDRVPASPSSAWKKRSTDLECELFCSCQAADSSSKNSIHSSKMEEEVPQEMDTIFDSMVPGLSIAVHSHKSRSRECTPRSSKSTLDKISPIAKPMVWNGCNHDGSSSDETYDLSGQSNGSGIDQRNGEGVGRGKRLQCLSANRPRSGIINCTASLRKLDIENGSTENKCEILDGCSPISRLEATKKAPDYYYQCNGGGNQMKIYGGVGRGQFLHRYCTDRSRSGLKSGLASDEEGKSGVDPLSDSQLKEWNEQNFSCDTQTNTCSTCTLDSSNRDSSGKQDSKRQDKAHRTVNREEQPMHVPKLELQNSAAIRNFENDGDYFDDDDFCIGQRTKTEVERRIVSLQRSIRSNEVELKRVAAKNDAMEREFESEMKDLEVDEKSELLPYVSLERIQEFDDLLRLSGKSTVATVALHSNETLRNNFKQKSYDMLGNNDLARLELDLLIKEEAAKEQLKVARLRNSLLQKKLDFYVDY